MRGRVERPVRGRVGRAAAALVGALLAGTLAAPALGAPDGIVVRDIIVSNTDPWTYFRSRPVTLSPRASFETGLDLVAMRRLRTVGTLWTASGMLTGHGARGRGVISLHDLREFRLAADRPMHFEVDGDYLGERESVQFQSVPAALRVIC